MSDQPVLDPSALDNLRAVSPDDADEFVKEIVGIFLDDTPGRLAELEASLDANESDTVARAAHTIKGSSANFGAFNLSAMAKKIEHLAKDGALGEVRPLVPGFKSEYERVAKALRELTGLAG